jgi:hypothetical protein
MLYLTIYRDFDSKPRKRVEMSPKVDLYVKLSWSLPLHNISHCAMGLLLHNGSPEYEWDIPLPNRIT